MHRYITRLNCATGMLLIPCAAGACDAGGLPLWSCRYCWDCPCSRQGFTGERPFPRADQSKGKERQHRDSRNRPLW